MGPLIAGRRPALLCVAFLLALPTIPALMPSAAAQEEPGLPATATTLRIAPVQRDSTFVLPHGTIQPGSDSLRTPDGLLLQRQLHYVLDYRRGRLKLTPAGALLVQPVWPDSAAVFSLRYRYIPLQFRDAYTLRTAITQRDSVFRDTVRVARPAAPLRVDDLFGADLQKSGSIVRGFTVGSNRDFSLTSGLRLQMAGRIGPDIEVAAALTDENTPIQPEGTTQTLQEFDKVFVELRRGSLAATLGDFVLDLGGTEFARINRKLQGGRGTAGYRYGDNDGAGTFAAAVTRGTFATLETRGIEGVQGPYRLTGRNGESAIIVIAGTERIYVDGERMTRGETNDYTIDYSTGEVRFTTRRLITSASRLVFDYEYSDRQYSRSLIAVQNGAGVWENRLRINATYLREADDPDSPIDLVLDDSVRTRIAQAGPDREKAAVTGVTRVDSLGSYVRVDSVINGSEPVTFYRYAPGNPAALYAVTFSYAGGGKGEYVRQRAGVFEWRGTGGGDYLPVRYLPLPTEHQIVDVGLSITPLDALTIGGEFARSTYSANRLSSLPGSRANGDAVIGTLRYAPQALRLGGTDLGALDVRYSHRQVGRNFVSIDRTNDVEFGRKWGADSLAAGDERLDEGTIAYTPLTGLTVGGGFGSFDRQGSTRSTRNEATVSVRRPGLPGLFYTREDVRGSDHRTGVDSRWLRQRGTLDYTVDVLRPFVRYEAENRTLTSGGAGAGAGSFRFTSMSGGVALTEWGRLSMSAEMGWRRDDRWDGDAVSRESDAFTQTYGLRLAEWNSITSTTDVTLRRKTMGGRFRSPSTPDVRSVLLRNQTHIAPLARAVESDLTYEVSTERSSRPERIFLRVATGTGTHRYLGDANRNGTADEEEFVPSRYDADYVATTVQTNDLIPVIDLRAGARLRLAPSRLIIEPETWFERVAAALSTETTVRVEEKSTTSRLQDVYLLRFSTFRRNGATLAGSGTLSQDLHLFEGDPDFTVRLRFTERKGLTEYAGGTERSYAREQSIRVRFQPLPDIGNQVDVVRRADRVDAPAASSRARAIEGTNLAYDLSYRPTPVLELGMRVETGSFTDARPDPPLTADINTQSVRCVLGFLGAGQARVEASREEVRLGAVTDLFPYELTEGRVAGKTWIWRAAFEYRLTDFLQSTMAYDGRAEGGAPPVHTARAEVRAFF